MSIEALWLVKFIDTNNTMHGNGVIVFESGRVFGGDSATVYLGTYEITHNILTIEVKLTKYAEANNMSIIFGSANEYKATFKGEYNDEHKIINLSGTAKGSNTEIIVIVTAKRYAELP